jgi:hypothetical protein
MRELAYVQGLCSLMLGDKQSAKQFFEAELGSYPDNEQAKKMYAML